MTSVYDLTQPRKQRVFSDIQAPPHAKGAFEVLRAMTSYATS